MWANCDTIIWECIHEIENPICNLNFTYIFDNILSNLVLLRSIILILYNSYQVIPYDYRSNAKILPPFTIYIFE